MQKHKKSISIVIPTYNEETGIASTIEAVKKALSDYSYEIIIVDDGSSDRTAEVLKSIKDIKIIKHPYNLGYGASLKHGITESKNETIVMIDADGSYPASSIPELLKYSDDYDMVSSARIGNNVNIPLIRRPAKFILSKLANFLTGMKIPDINSGLRVIKKSNVIKFFNILPNRFSFTITHLLACLTQGYTVKFVPIEYHKRKGKSSIRPSDFVKFSVIIFRVVTYFNPLRMFTLASVILLLFALITFLYSFFIRHNIYGIVIIILVLAALQVFLAGLIAYTISKK